MPITTTHRFVSKIQDDPDSGIVRPSAWDDTHVVVANIDLTSEVMGVLPAANGGTGTTTGGVTSAAGTANQVLVNGTTTAKTGAITLSLPQSIATTSNVQFNSVLLQNQYFTALNGGAATINVGDVVYYTGSIGGAVYVDKAQSNSTGTMPACGVATASVAANALGIFQSQGVFTGIDTSLLGLNATAYVSPTTAGAIVTAIADSNITKQAIGKVLTLATNGVVLLSFQQGVGAALGYLGSLVDIAANGVTNAKLRQSAGLSIVGRSANTTGNVADITGTTNQVLRVLGTTLGFGSLDLSQSGTVGSSVLGVANGGTGATAFTAGSVVFAGASGVYSQDNSNFFYDATNKRLGIGATPLASLHVGDAVNPATFVLGVNSTTGGYTALIAQLSAVSGGYANIQAVSSSGTSYGNLVMQRDGGNASFFGASSFGSGVGVLSLANCGTIPTTNPTAGYFLYATANSLKGRGGSGTVTNIGNADPHCPVCRSDFAVQWENPIYGGKLTICMKCLSAELGSRPYIRWNEPEVTQ